MLLDRRRGGGHHKSTTLAESSEESEPDESSPSFRSSANMKYNSICKNIYVHRYLQWLQQYWQNSVQFLTSNLYKFIGKSNMYPKKYTSTRNILDNLLGRSGNLWTRTVCGWVWGARGEQPLTTWLKNTAFFSASARCQWQKCMEARSILVATTICSSFT